jgi:hypothetical protein
MADRVGADAGDSTSGGIPLLYIGGSGRSGSTLLERLVGQLPDVVPLGEVVFLWRRGVLEDQLCGCGERFSSCPFWTAVGERAFGGWGSIDLDEVLSLQRAVDRNRFIPLMVAGRPAGYRREMRRFADYLLPVYRSALEVSGARVLIDSSKHASSAFLLSRLGGLDLRVVHLVRDSRGVAYSWTKQVRKPEVVDGTSYMPRYAPGRQSLYWLAYNAMFEGLPAAGVATARLRYEWLLREPRREIERVARFVGAPADDEALAFLSGRSAELHPNHTVSGNPMRFKNGSVELRVDDAWRRELPRAQAALVSSLTWPLQRRYGYR